MARINLPPKKEKNYNRNNTDKRKLRIMAYNSTAWRKLRLKYLMEHPMCEDCEKNPAVDIHHMKSFIVNNQIDWNILLNEKNLKALCKTCHGNEHSKHETNEELIERLNKMLENE